VVSRAMLDAAGFRIVAEGAMSVIAVRDGLPPPQP